MRTPDGSRGHARVCKLCLASTRPFYTAAPPLTISAADHLRCELNRWRADGCVGDLPQPRAFGLRLPPLLPHEIWWQP